MTTSSKQTTENKPPKWATPLFEKSASEATKLYDSGAGGNVYQGQTVADLGRNTRAGINSVSQIAQDPTTSNRLNGIASGIMGIGGVGTSGYGSATNAANGISGTANNLLSGIAGNGGDLSSTANNLLSGIAGGTTGIGTESDYRGLLDRASNPFSSETNLKDIASGAYLKNGNPYFEDALKGQLDKTAAQVQSQFSGSGRYGSGANNGVLTSELGNIRSGALSDQFNRDSANMLTANGMIDAATANRLGIQSNAIGGITGVQGQNVANRLSGSGQILGAQGQDVSNRLSASGQIIGAQSDTANQLRGIQDSISQVEAGNADRSLNQYNSAANIYGQDQQNRLANAQAQIGAGQLQDQNTQDKLQAEYAKFLGEDMKDWTRLGLLQSAAAGSAGNYGTSAQTSTQPFNPLSAIGGIGSLASKSDIRAKEHIVPVGVENGYTVYEFSYRGSKARWRGVMAQEVVERDPLAVTITNDGFLAVYYNRIGVECRRAA